MMKNKGIWKSLVLASTAAAIAVVPSSAELIEFDLGSSGTISYSGGNNPIVGTSIAVTTLLASDNPQNNGTYTVQDGLLSFQTGDFASYDSNAQLLTFNPGGTITLTGSVVTPDGLITGSSDDPLLSGSFVGATFDLNLNRFSLFLGNGPDVKNGALVSYFYGDAPPPSWSFSAEIYGTGDVRDQYHSDGTFSTDVVDSLTAGSTTLYSRVVNTDPPAAVPEPASIVLLVTCIVAIGFVSARRRANLPTTTQSR